MFSFQIYFDFSGYSDIAIGSGKILGFNLPQNFNVPLISQSITEFWRRWHISLSTWLRDYLFTPIAFVTRAWGKYSVVLALFVTFLLAGMWHGAGWTFIIFGALHGGALVYEVLSKNFRKKLSKAIPAVIYDKFCMLLAFSFLSFAFIFFRSADLMQAEYYITHMFTDLSLKFGGYRLGIGQFEFLLVIILIILAMIAEISTVKNNGLIEWVSSKPTVIRWGFYYLVVLLILCFGVFGEYSFVYFKF
jgi:D-alanyl-lipoteichoic acid acyltransferase DltB (MBOAT superfamily)